MSSCITLDRRYDFISQRYYLTSSFYYCTCLNVYRWCIVFYGVSRLLAIFLFLSLSLSVLLRQYCKRLYTSVRTLNAKLKVSISSVRIVHVTRKPKFRKTVIDVELLLLKLVSRIRGQDLSV